MRFRFSNCIPCRSYGLGRSFLLGTAVGVILGFATSHFMFKDSKSLSKKSARIPREMDLENPNNTVSLQDLLENKLNSENIVTTTIRAIETTLESQNDTEGNMKTKATSKTKSGQNVRVLCWILTNPGNHMWKAIHVKKTWGKRCTKLVFMSSKADPKLPSIALPNVKEGRDWLWAKSKEALKYIYAHYIDEADWFLKADDDTYVIMENLKDLVRDYNPNRAYLFGYEFITDWLKYTYMSGGAGYVMSKEALKRFVEKSLYMNDTKCYTSYHDGMEDIEVSKCLLSVNTTFANSRDSRGRERFNPTSSSWDLGRYQNLDCCSDTAITFHYILPHEMYYLEYMLYHLRPGKLGDEKRIQAAKKRKTAKSKTIPPSQMPTTIRTTILAKETTTQKPTTDSSDVSTRTS